MRGWPLPQPSPDDDKEDRGDVLVVGGSAQTPGAIFLAAVSALRAGAGRLSVATADSVATGLALMLPEARVIGLPEAERGALSPRGIERLVDALEQARVVLLGPGCLDPAGTLDFATALLARPGRDAELVVDAAAMGAVARASSGVGAAVLTPHAGEMARLTGLSREDVRRRAAEVASDAARQWQCIVVLKGATTFVANPHGDLWRHEAGNVGLATSGSGDVLAGLIAGLVARGASLEQAAVWGVALHSRAGAVLAERSGPLGFMAGELAAEVPRLMRDLGGN